MKKFIFLLLIPVFCNANTPTVFKSSCSGIQYSIESFCSVNNLNDDQDKLTIPICSKQIFTLGKENHDLSESTGFVERINMKGEKIKMMNFVFYGATCKSDRIILSGAGGCNSCGEMFKILFPIFIKLIIVMLGKYLVKSIYCRVLWFLPS